MKLSGTKLSAALALGAAFALTSLGAAMAQDGATIIVQRQALMKLQPANLGAIKAAIDSKDAKRMTDAAKQAEALEFAAKVIPTFFPKGSDGKAGKTNALDKVWADPAGFKKAADGMGGLAKSLGEALKSGDAGKAMAAFGVLGKEGCGGCHGDYRVKLN